MKFSRIIQLKEVFPEASSDFAEIFIQGLSDHLSFQAGDCVVCFQKNDWEALKSHPQLNELALVIIPPDAECSVDLQKLPVMTDPRPRLLFAKLLQFFTPVTEAFIHPTAMIHPSAQIAASASIGPYVVIQENCIIGESTIIGSHCYLGPQTKIGAHCTLSSHVSIGNPGFGFERLNHSWLHIPHLSGVTIGHRCSIGSMTSIAAGVLHPTSIGDDVIIDNHVQIAHHVSIGSGTAIAGCVGIAGSTHIGRNCLIGGGAMITGHISIVDQVSITGMTMVTKSLKKKGVYSSGMPVSDHADWKKKMAAFNRMTSRYLEKIHHGENE